jgi:chemotaxis signal transduction protein
MSQPAVPFPRDPRPPAQDHDLAAGGDQWSNRAGAMRAEFDAAFARPPRNLETDLEDVIALRLDDEPCVLRLSEIAGVIAHPLLTVLPTPAPALLGIIGNRGSVVAAYDLGRLDGGPASRPGWLVIAAAEPTVGVAFEHFDGYRRIRTGSLDAGRLIEMTALVATIRSLSDQPHLTHRHGADQEYES